MKTFQQLREAYYPRYKTAARNINAGHHVPGTQMDNVFHTINADGDHEFKGEWRHKIIKKDDTEGLHDHLKHLHDNVLGHGNMVVLNKGVKGKEKMFNGGAPGVDALKSAIAHSTNESLTSQMGAELKDKLGAKIRSGKQPRKQIDTSKPTGNSTWRNKIGSDEIGSKID